MTVSYYPRLCTGTAGRIAQDASKETYRRLRTAEDGIIDWNKSSRDIFNLVRATTFPYPCASTFHNGVEIKVVSCEETLLNRDYPEYENGIIIEAWHGNGSKGR